jgi:hypothetical protein
LNDRLKKDFAMSYYEAAKKVQKQKEMEKYLEVIRQATAELERRICNKANDR